MNSSRLGMIRSGDLCVEDLREIDLHVRRAAELFPEVCCRDPGPVLESTRLDPHWRDSIVGMRGLDHEHLFRAAIL